MPYGYWVYDPHSGGVKVPLKVQERIRKRIEDYAEMNYKGKYTRLDIRFRGQLCYIDAFTEPAIPSKAELRSLGETLAQHLERLRNVPIHLCRLRYFGDENQWSYCFFSYANMRYEPCVFDNGTFKGTPEEAFKSSEMYLQY